MSEVQATPPAEPPLPAAAPATTTAAEDGGIHPPPLNFWRRRWVQNVLPWASSVVIHIGLIIVMLATYQAAGKFFKVIQEQIVIPDASLATDPGSVPNPGMGDEHDRTASQSIDSSVTESSGLARARTALNAALINTPTGNPGDQAGSLIGLPGNNHGQVAGGGLADSTGGALAQFGNPGGGNIGPRGRVFGHGGNAMRIVYICDASGSMMTKMDLLKLELGKSVQQLQPIQAFDVIFFQDSVGNPSSHIDLAPDLLMATAANKKKLYTFLEDIVGQSSTHVIPALTATFRLPTHPDLVYLLTDGAFEDEGAQAVTDAIRQLNADKKVKINTILFLGKDIDPDELKDASSSMKKIASENGGVYNQVSVSELGN
jgi:hypothetical protein